MYVFQIIKRIFEHVFPPRTIETSKLLMEEADVLMTHVKAAKTLAELLEMREVLRKFRGAVELAGSQQQVKNKLVFLEAQWNRQFRLWKSRG
jgi:hypothetical protein